VIRACGAWRVRVFVMSVAVVALGGMATPASGEAAASGNPSAQARHALIVRSDLPAGWTTTPSINPGSANFTGAPQLASCIGVPTQLIANTPPEVDSPRFQDKGAALAVQDTISVYPSARFARQEFAAISSNKTPGCISALLQDVGAGTGSTTVRRLTSPKGTAAFTVDTTVQSAGGAGTHLELVYLTEGQLGDAITLVGAGPPPPTALARHLLAVAKSRL